ncbi:hypothetical protein QTP88_009339 [Uroleucon formosanum]
MTPKEYLRNGVKPGKEASSPNDYQPKIQLIEVSKNGLPNGSVLALTLFNINTNYQPISTDQNTTHFIYVNDSAIAIHKDVFDLDIYFDGRYWNKGPKSTY